MTGPCHRPKVPWAQSHVHVRLIRETCPSESHPCPVPASRRSATWRGIGQDRSRHPPLRGARAPAARRAFQGALPPLRPRRPPAHPLDWQAAGDGLQPRRDPDRGPRLGAARSAPQAMVKMREVYERSSRRRALRRRAPALAHEIEASLSSGDLRRLRARSSPLRVPACDHHARGRRAGSRRRLPRHPSRRARSACPRNSVVTRASPMAVKLPIYMDNHATTPVDPRVLEAMLPYFTKTFGNAASRNHAFGWKAEAAVEKRARAGRAARSAPTRQGDRLHLRRDRERTTSRSRASPSSTSDKGNHIITAKTEHKAVLDTCKRLERQGFARHVPAGRARTAVVDPATGRSARSPTRRSSSRSCSPTTRSAPSSRIAEIGAHPPRARRALPHATRCRASARCRSTSTR